MNGVIVVPMSAITSKSPITSTGNFSVANRIMATRRRIRVIAMGDIEPKNI